MVANPCVPVPPPQVHCNNMHTRGVSIFGEVECRFKRSLATAWEPTSVTHSLAGGVKDPSARSVTVPLGGRQARFIQCHFFFAAEWMLFSEITFLSGESNCVRWPPDLLGPWHPPPTDRFLGWVVGGWGGWLGEGVVGWVMGWFIE